MSKEFRVTLSGQSEKLFQELNSLGFSDQDILSRAFWYLKQVHSTGRVALLTPAALVDNAAEPFVEVIYTVVERESVPAVRGRGRIGIRERIQGGEAATSAPEERSDRTSQG